MDLFHRFVGIWIVFATYVAVGVEGAKYDEACTNDGDCKETNAAKCDSGTSKCICTDNFFRKTTATECAAKVALDGTCIVTDSAKDQCSVVNTECRTEGSESKCLCKATHYSDGSACQTRKKPEETCAAHQCVTHATCNTTTNPTKCKCDAGYTATPATKPTMCSGVMKVATLWYMLAVPIYVSMMSLLR